MKIGLVVHFFDFRNDVRILLSELIGLGHQVVVFHQAEDREAIQLHAPAGVEFREMREKSKSANNRIWEQLFFWLGKLPKSKRNFQLMELFKISLQPSMAVQKSAKAKLLRRMALPELVSYDAYLNGIDFAGKTEIEDIDRFVFFTDIYDGAFLARVMQSGKPLNIYVYSWDHPCKHTRYTKRANYLVWSEGMATDLVELQGIARNRIRVLGANQFGYIERYQAQQGLPYPRPFEGRYVYFGCAIGIPGLVERELDVVRLLAKALAKSCPDWSLVVRPYPVLKEWHHYEKLREIGNIVLDDSFRSKDRSIGDAQILDKFRAIESAEAFFHLGTTLGLEAAHTPTPSFLIDLEYFAKEKNVNDLTIYHFVHQYQNDTYLNNVAGANVVRKEADLEGLFLELRNGPAQFAEGNRAITKAFVVKSFGQVARDFVAAIEANG